MQILNLNSNTQGMTSLQTIEHPIISFSNVLTIKPFPITYSDFTVKTTNIFLTITNADNTQVVEIPITGPYKFDKNITIGNFVISCDNQNQYDNIVTYIDSYLNREIVEESDDLIDFEIAEDYKDNELLRYFLTVLNDSI